MSAISGFELSDGQRRFFDDFGYLALRGRLADEVEWIEDGFESIFTADEPRFYIPFADRHEKLATLVDHPSTTSIASALVGPDWNYMGSDGNIYGGDTRWHRDGVWRHLRFVKIVMYLDPVAADTGALRVVPGSNRTKAPLDEVWPRQHDPALYGIEGRDMPSVALDSEPGDVVVFDHGLLHASFGGGGRRRMFTLNACRRAETDEERGDLLAYIAQHVNFGTDTMYGPFVREGGPPERRPRLEQVLANQGHLVALARERAAQPTVSGVV
jgi:hypothetical protein